MCLIFKLLWVPTYVYCVKTYTLNAYTSTVIAQSHWNGLIWNEKLCKFITPEEKNKFCKTPEKVAGAIEEFRISLTPEKCQDYINEFHEVL